MSTRTDAFVVAFLALAALMLLTQPVPAAPYRTEFQAPGYDEAEAAPTYIRFHMRSTKLGLFSSSFDGFVKSFAVTADVDGTQAQGVRVEFPVRAMDTDNGMRNDKMFEYCLDAEAHPMLAVRLDGPVKLDAASADGKVQEVPGTITVRGADHPIMVRVSVVERGGGLQILGQTQLSLSGLNVPDPSIAIASVDDTVDVAFQLQVNKDPLAAR